MTDLESSSCFVGSFCSRLSGHSGCGFCTLQGPRSVVFSSSTFSEMWTAMKIREVGNNVTESDSPPSTFWRLILLPAVYSFLHLICCPQQPHLPLSPGSLYSPTKQPFLLLRYAVEDMEVP